MRNRLSTLLWAILAGTILSSCTSAFDSGYTRITEATLTPDLAQFPYPNQTLF